MVSRLRAWWRALFRRATVESELDEELRYHLEKLVEEQRAAGLGESEARAAALASFGGFAQAKEECRDAWGARVAADFARDLRFAVRSLRRSPGFAAAVVVSLALGLGANAAIFGLINAVFWRPLAVAEPQRLVLLGNGTFRGRDNRLEPGRLNAASHPLYQRLRAGTTTSFAGLAAEDSSPITAIVRASDGAGEDESTSAAAIGRLVSASYFEVLGVRAQRGRTFGPEDDGAPGTNAVLVLSHGYWRRRFAGDPAVIGRSVTVEGRSHVVVGVAPRGFTGTEVGGTTDFWIPMSMQASFMPALLQRGEMRWLLLVGRLKPGVGLAAAEADVNATLQRFLADHPATGRGATDPATVRIVLEPGGKGVSDLRRGFRDPLTSLMVGVGLLLAIVWLNVSHLLLARGLDRRRELGIRGALGASRGRLGQQLLAEGLLLSLLGAAGAVLVCRWGSDGLIALLAGPEAPAALDLRPDGRLLAFAAALGLATTALLGIVPAWQAWRLDVHESLRTASRPGNLGGGKGLAGRLLMASQVGLSLVLLVGAGLLAVSLARLRAMDKGFDEEHVLLVEIGRPRLVKLTTEQGFALGADLEARVSAIPGVRAASLSACGLLACGPQPFIPQAAAATAAPTQVLHGIVTPGYFDSVGMRLLHGRPFDAGDRAGAPPVAVINETLARHFFGAASAAIGRRIVQTQPQAWEAAVVEVVGVVADSRIEQLRRPPAPAVLIPGAQYPGFSFLRELQVRAHPGRDPALLGAAVRRAVREAHPQLDVARTRAIGAELDRWLTGERLLAALSGAFGLSALFLVSVGLHGVVSQWARRRTQEIGVRRALGATSGRVARLVVRQALLVVAAGLAIGVPAALAASRVIEELLWGVHPLDVRVLAGAALALVAVAAAAAYLPARRAARVDPIASLRCE